MTRQRPIHCNRKKRKKNQGAPRSQRTLVVALGIDALFHAAAIYKVKVCMEKLQSRGGGRIDYLFFPESFHETTYLRAYHLSKLVSSAARDRKDTGRRTKELQIVCLSPPLV